MKITINGDVQSFEQPLTIRQLLVKLALTEQRLAVEVNQAVVPRSQHQQHGLADGDRVEIVHAIGGG